MIKKKILIVDDNVGFCNTLQKIMTKFGYESEVAHSRGEALTYMKKDISLFLLDIGLPGSDEEGLELLREIKSYKPMASVIMITGNQNYDFLVHCISSGATDFFIKSKLDVDYMKKAIDKEFEKHNNWLSVMKNIKQRSISDFELDVIKQNNFQVAFVDDEPQFLDMMKKVSEKLHLNASFYSTSEELLKSDITYQLMFIDLWLKDSDKNGLDLIRELKSKSPFSELVVISGDLSSDSMVLFSEFGVQDYIFKANFDPYTVMDIVDRSRSKFERWLKEQPNMKKYIKI